MLERENEPLQKLWKNRILKIGIVLITYSGLYSLYYNFPNFVDIKLFLKTIIISRYLNCIAVFMTVKVIAETFKIPEKLEKIVLILGKSTFGVYLLHLFVLSSSLI